MENIIIIVTTLIWLYLVYRGIVYLEKKPIITIVLKGKFDLPKGSIIQTGMYSKAKVRKSEYKDGNTILKVIKL